MILAETHGRAGIIGNPTDGYGGSLIACSTRNKAITTLAAHDRLQITNLQGSAVFSSAADFENKGDYFDIVRCVLRYFKAYDLRATIRTHSDIPVQAGLAGSTAVLSTILAAVAAFLGRRIHPYQMAEINRDIELNYLECQCGYQDAYMTTFGGLNYLDFRGKAYYKPWHREQYGTVENLSAYTGGALPFVVAHTGISHHSGRFHRPLRERWLEGDPAVIKGYRDIEDLAREGKKALLDQNWDTLAYLMNQNHQIQDSLADSGEQNNRMIQTALANGGLAAKLAGAGGGGTIIVLTQEPGRVQQALLETGADLFIGLEPAAPGITVQETEAEEHRVDTP